MNNDMEIEMPNNREEIINKLKELSDDNYKKLQMKLCPNVNNIIGVRVPKLREYAKELSKENWKKNYNFLKNEYYEETMLQGMMLGLGKNPIQDTITYLKCFIPEIDNWATCDVTCAGLKFTKKNQETMWKFINSYIRSTKEFERRFAVVMILDYYIIDEYIDQTLKTLDKIKTKEYYVMMAVAWAVSVAYIKYPEKGMEYLEKCHLDLTTYNMALQKILDSYRVSDEKKSKIRMMKRK